MGALWCPSHDLGLSWVSGLFCCKKRPEEDDDEDQFLSIDGVVSHILCKGMDKEGRAMRNDSPWWTALPLE